MASLAHHHRYILDDNVFTHYWCIICNYKRQLKESKIKLLHHVANEQPDKFESCPVSEKTLLKILEEGHSNVGLKQPPVTPQPKMCMYCGKLAMVTKDHKYPKMLIRKAKAEGKKVKGCGKVDACIKCNREKGNYLITDWLAKLQRHCDPRARFVEKVAERCGLLWLLLLIQVRISNFYYWK